MKTVKSKRTMEINYFANLSSCHTETESVKLMAHPANSHSLPFNTARTESLESPFRKANRRPTDKYISYYRLDY